MYVDFYIFGLHVLLYVFDVFLLYCMFSMLLTELSLVGLALVQVS